MTPAQIASDAIDAFMDYLDRADCDLMLSEREIDRAKAAAIKEVHDVALDDNAKHLREINARLLNVLCDVVALTTLQNVDPNRLAFAVTMLNDRMIAAIREARGLPPLE